MTIPSVTLPCGGYKYSSVHGFIACNDVTTFIVCNPSTGQVTTFPCKATGTCLGYDPVGDQFKALTHVTSIFDHMHNPSCFMVHEVITLGGGGGGLVSRSRVTSPYYRPMTVGLCINGFINERILSFITTPKEVLVWKVHTSLIEYKGKLAVVVPTNCLRTGSSFDRFDLWILEDVTKHEWSRQSFQLPLSLPFAFRRSQRMISQGTNKAGEIIFSPTSLPGRAQPFYVFYFNPDTKSTRRVRIHGVADTEEFWSRHGLTGMCCVSFSPQHDDSIAFL
ncbi:hypothetical protein Bca52824_090505 [Brassica carinata]|uniref:F-box associated beta-propeller type 3 domain-containing protein n=1 Tax=Brassica carinata TaxID=52824 RepID=A0A8X7NWF8_BRACI|nr:hypothetical protein Bca52824_090505 [Brassica carinata]